MPALCDSGLVIIDRSCEPLLWQEFQQEQERREELKQQIALAATRLLQDPEHHSRELQPLVQLVSSRDDVVSATN